MGIKQRHNNWFMHIFNYPVVVKDLLMSFVHEDFVKDLEFASLKKLNPDFSCFWKISPCRCYL